MDLEDFLNPNTIDNLSDIGKYLLSNLTVFYLSKKIKIVPEDYFTLNNQFRRSCGEMREKWEEAKKANDDRYSYIFK